jgi:hypothetical protein
MIGNEDYTAWLGHAGGFREDKPLRTSPGADTPNGSRTLGRAASFDPRVDSVLRVEASRLRSRLAEYYRTEGEQLRALDPLSAALRGVEAAVFYLTGDYDRTIEHAHAVLAGQPDLWLLYFWMGRAHDSKGRFASSRPMEEWSAGRRALST